MTVDSAEAFRRQINRLAVAFSLLLIGTTAAGFMGGLVWWLDLAAHFRVQLLIGAVALSLVFSVLCRYRWAVVLVVVTLVNAATVAPLYFANATPAQGDADVGSTRLLIANLNSGNRDYASLIALVGEERPDILLLLEVNAPWLVALQALTKDYVHVCECSRPDNFGVAVFSRLPFEHAGILRLGSAGLPSVEVHVKPKGRSLLRIVLTHPLPPMRGGMARERDEQLLAVAEYTQALGPGVVVAGDFNATPWSSIFGELIERSGLQDSMRGYGPQASWPATVPGLFRIPIDHCLYSTDLQVIDRRLTRGIGSDHLPLIVDLR